MTISSACFEDKERREHEVEKRTKTVAIDVIFAISGDQGGCYFEKVWYQPNKG